MIRYITYFISRRCTGCGKPPAGCISFPTMTYIGCMNGAGCVYPEGLSNTAVAAPWSGGNADGFAQNYLGTYDMRSHDEPGIFYLNSGMGGLDSRSVRNPFFQRSTVPPLLFQPQVSTPLWWWHRSRSDALMCPMRCQHCILVQHKSRETPEYQSNFVIVTCYM